MPYFCFIVIAAASWRLTVDDRWDAWWIGFLTLLLIGGVLELLDRRRDRARREAAYQKRKAQRDA
jgi:cbb3-type cytochrome oxidase subunit 3